MLGLDQVQLSEAARVARATLIDFEKGQRTPRAGTIAAIQAALEAQGVEFTNGDAPGVRLRKS